MLFANVVLLVVVAAAGQTSNKLKINLIRNFHCKLPQARVKKQKMIVNGQKSWELANENVNLSGTHTHTQRCTDTHTQIRTLRTHIACCGRLIPAPKT